MIWFLKFAIIKMNEIVKKQECNIRSRPIYLKKKKQQQLRLPLLITLCGHSSIEFWVYEVYAPSRPTPHFCVKLTDNSKKQHAANDTKMW